MNPSASGWIKKLLKEVSRLNYAETNRVAFYQKLKASGFIYGSSISIVTSDFKSVDFTEEERSKVNLMLTFYFVHLKEKSKTNFIESLISYYKSISNPTHSIFDGLFGSKRSSSLLEKIIHKRIHIDDNFISKSFNNFLINALLFVDVLGYQKFLAGEKNVKMYVENLESSIETIIFGVIDSKLKKTTYDHNLIKLFESSLRHKNHSLPLYSDAIQVLSNPLEKLYVLDLACMASWSDKVIDKEEHNFLNRLKEDLNLNTLDVSNSIAHINDFYDLHKNEVAFLRSKNLAQSFYNNSSKVVIKLIKRNSKRLLKELVESKEAMVLLTKSTQRNLTQEEQKKVQEQLLDIFKSIPSLAIFMLPGGMLLLPLFVKFIPKLLPSAFDENRIEDN